MSIPNLIRYEAQVAATGRAKCRICGSFVGKGTYIFKILGFRINQSLHPECVANLTIGLGDAIKELGKDRDYILRAFDGIIKVGYYEPTKDPGKYRFTTLKIVKLVEQGGIANAE